jgi:hypothetical protein
MPIDVATLDAFTLAYIECALWTSTDDDGEPLDGTYSVEDIAPESLASIVEDCDAFQESHGDDLGDDDDRAGQDFWLTRNGHGAGFWDGDWEEPAATRLTDSAEAYGSSDLYIGDDGKVYVS